MKVKRWATGGTVLLLGTLLAASRSAYAENGSQYVVRLAELDIDSAHLEAYKAALREEIETSIRLESGVLTLYAFSAKEHPTEIRLLEVYANAAAYQEHLQSVHFRKYKTETAGMVKSLKLIETEPILLGAK